MAYEDPTKEPTAWLFLKKRKVAGSIASKLDIASNRRKMNPTTDDSISPMAPILRGRAMAPVRTFGMPLQFGDPTSTLAESKTGCGYFLVCLGGLIPMIIAAYKMVYPMLADLPFLTWYFVVLPDFGFTRMDQGLHLIQRNNPPGNSSHLYKGIDLHLQFESKFFPI